MVSSIEEREGGWTTKVDSTTATSSSAATSAKGIWRWWNLVLDSSWKTRESHPLISPTTREWSDWVGWWVCLPNNYLPTCTALTLAHIHVCSDLRYNLANLKSGIARANQIFESLVREVCKEDDPFQDFVDQLNCIPFDWVSTALNEHNSYWMSN